MYGTLKNSEVRQLAYEIARDHPEFNCNDSYHRNIESWAKARGGAEVGTWNAWTQGWAEGLQLHMKPKA